MAQQPINSMAPQQQGTPRDTPTKTNRQHCLWIVRKSFKQRVCGNKRQRQRT